MVLFVLGFWGHMVAQHGVLHRERPTCTWQQYQYTIVPSLFQPNLRNGKLNLWDDLFSLNLQMSVEHWRLFWSNFALISMALSLKAQFQTVTDTCWFLGIEGCVLSSPVFRVWWGRSLARSCKTWREERRRWWDWVWWNHSGHSWGSHSPPETARWKISPLINYRNGELINQQAVWESLQRPSQMFNTVKWI